jgi:hypothetical protein
MGARLQVTLDIIPYNFLKYAQQVPHSTSFVDSPGFGIAEEDPCGGAIGIVSR